MIRTPPVAFTQISLLKRKQRQCEIIEHFWKRWKNDYLTSLREFHKAYGNNNQRIKVGDVVLVHDESPRMLCKMAVVTDLVRGNDGLVRAAKIRMKNTETSRPIVKLYPLEIRSATDDADQSICDKDRPKRDASVKAKENIRKWLNLPSGSGQ